MSKYTNVQQQTETLNVITAQPPKSFFVTGTVQMQVGSKISQGSQISDNLREVILKGKKRQCTIYVSEKDIETFKTLFQQQPSELSD